MTNQLRFGIDIDGAGVLSIRKSNSKYSAANLQASFKEEAKEVRAHNLNKIVRPTTHEEALGFQIFDILDQKLLLLHFQAVFVSFLSASGKFLYFDLFFNNYILRANIPRNFVILGARSILNLKE